MPGPETLLELLIVLETATAASPSAPRVDELIDGEGKRDEEDENGEHLEPAGAPAWRTPAAAMRSVLHIARIHIFAALAVDGGQGHWAIRGDRLARSGPVEARPAFEGIVHSLRPVA